MSAIDRQRKSVHFSGRDLIWTKSRIATSRPRLSTLERFRPSSPFPSITRDVGTLCCSKQLAVDYWGGPFMVAECGTCSRKRDIGKQETYVSELSATRKIDRVSRTTRPHAPKSPTTSPSTGGNESERYVFFARGARRR